MKFPAQYSLTFEAAENINENVNHVVGRIYVHNPAKADPANELASIVGRALVWCSPKGRINIAAPEAYSVRLSTMGRRIESLGELMHTPTTWGEESTKLIAEAL